MQKKIYSVRNSCLRVNTQVKLKNVVLRKRIKAKLIQLVEVKGLLLEGCNTKTISNIDTYTYVYIDRLKVLVCYL